VVGDGVELGDGEPVVVTIVVREGDGVDVGIVLGADMVVVFAGVGEGAGRESLCEGLDPELVPDAKPLDDFRGGSTINMDVELSTPGGGNTMAPWRTIKCGDEILVVDKEWLIA
jgi:hypothetical protein